MRALSILAFSVFFAASVVCFAADESLTITTYYPSPYGLYNQLQAKSLGVGDNNNNGAIDTGDVPTTSGDAWIKGNVGIGTAAPGAKLHILGSSQSTLAVDSPAYPELTFRVGGAIKSYDAIATSAGGYMTGSRVGDRIIRAEAGSILLGYSGTPTLTVTSSNTVGIGTTAPRSRFDVGSGSGWEVLRINGGNSGNSSGSAVYFDNAGLAYSAIGNYSAIFGGAYNNALTLYTSGANTIVPNGKVGIGTANPEALLSVGQVNGTLPANSIYIGSAAGTAASFLGWQNGIGNFAIGLPANSADLYISNDYGYPTGSYPASQSIVLKNNGYVGIGVASPVCPLHVGKSFVPNSRVTYQIWDSGLPGHILALEGGNNDPYGIEWRFWQQNLGIWYPVLTFVNGHVGVDTQTPDLAYWVTLGGNTLVQGSIAASGFYPLSDLRLKENISSISNPLAKVLKLRGIEFNWKDKELPYKDFPKGRQIGVIAQEVEKQFPELVGTGSQGYKTVDYDKLSAVLIEAIKEQQKEIEALKSQVARLDRK